MRCCRAERVTCSPPSGPSATMPSTATVCTANARCSLGRNVRAVVVREPGPPENLEPAELARPTAGAGRVVVRVAAAGVNPVDATNRADPSWSGIEPPYVVGYEFAGWIEEVGAGVAKFARGDAVW